MVAKKRSDLRTFRNEDVSGTRVPVFTVVSVFRISRKRSLPPVPCTHSPTRPDLPTGTSSKGPGHQCGSWTTLFLSGLPEQQVREQSVHQQDVHIERVRRVERLPGAPLEEVEQQDPLPSLPSSNTPSRLPFQSRSPTPHLSSDPSVVLPWVWTSLGPHPGGCGVCWVTGPRAQRRVKRCHLRNDSRGPGVNPSWTPVHPDSRRGRPGTGSRDRHPRRHGEEWGGDGWNSTSNMSRPPSTNPCTASFNDLSYSWSCNDLGNLYNRPSGRRRSNNNTSMCLDPQFRVQEWVDPRGPGRGRVDHSEIWERVRREEGRFEFPCLNLRGVYNGCVDCLGSWSSPARGGVHQGIRSPSLS